MSNNTVLKHQIINKMVAAITKGNKLVQPEAIVLYIIHYNDKGWPVSHIFTQKEICTLL